jgi:hypothetical protein
VVSKTPPADEFGTTEAHLWRWQREAMSDLLAFIDEHAPGKRKPLPTVWWRVGPALTVSAEVGQFEADPSGSRVDRPGIVAAYAAVLGVKMTTRGFENSTRYTAKGLIGMRAGTAKIPRTTLTISADVWHDRDETDGLFHLMS